ncbi:MAG: hypothetical protein ACOYXT_12480 [Bacteroidota bacterium]
MKKIGAISVILIFLCNGAGFYVYYCLQLQQIRSEMREALKLRPDHELEILQLTIQQFEEASVDENEILFNGKMYDIARVEKAEKEVKIYCLHDEKEDSLLTLLDEVVSKPMKHKDSLPGQIFQFISLIYVVPPEEIVFETQFFGEYLISRYEFSIQDFHRDIMTPPPRV